MNEQRNLSAVDRKQFLRIAGRAGVAACMCGAAVGAARALDIEPGIPGQQKKPAAAPQSRPGDALPSRAAKRMEFVDQWVPRFFRVIDAELDEPTRRRVMAANGKACFSGYRPDLKRRADPATREEVATWVARRGKAAGYEMDGDTITFEYVGSAETGEAAPKRVCLCPTAEGQGANRMSPTFCWCSVGYVKEMHERVFGRPLNVQIVQSVLMGDPRCRFRITLA